MARRTLLTGGLVVLVAAGAFALTGASGSRTNSGCCPITSLFVGGTEAEAADVAATDTPVVGCGGNACSIALDEPVLCKACGLTKVACHAGGKCNPAAATCKGCGTSKMACKAAGGCKAGAKTCTTGCRTAMVTKVAEVKAALATARTAVEAGQKAEALAAIATAEKLVTDMHQKMAAKGAAPKAAAAGATNTHCPIMGRKIDQANVPAALQREFNGQTIGFCCGGCPVAWDKLTDAQKQAKLTPLLK